MKVTRKRRRRIRKRWIALAICLLMVVPTVSYVRALLYPGSASFSVRTVEWFRDHGGGGIVDAIETWKYTHQQPPATGAPIDVTTPTSTAPTIGRPGARAASTGLPVVQLLPGVKRLEGEGTWSVARQSRTGVPLIWTSWVRADPGHLPVTAAAALMPRNTYHLHLMPGTREPLVGMRSKNGYSVPQADRSALVATFNAGFKMNDSHGGWWTTESAAIPLVDGRASVVISRDGSARIGTWNRTVRMTKDVVAVRQNLDPLIVDGRIADNLTVNANGRWGTLRSQLQYTWRSGLGTDAHGNLIYVAGNKLTLATLASAMHQAGIVQGLELDIHPAIVSFNIDRPGANGAVTGQRLLQSMVPPANRYLVDDQRDFFYVTAK
ncbi:phosphodiester glycosidase family protein [Kribbella sp.]|uniref:phosphodiester glycosidase family protein n=1 Tax=Kribbella sp. TaxID=1871183 RepID=UPI002D55E2C5|nr:phosphodiester glycosidase family protein [Kribbella sp.]HZX09121.1 phosphodiester glycosidase family protein [Kribbella sp.]